MLSLYSLEMITIIIDGNIHQRDVLNRYDYFRDNFKDSTTNKANRMRRDCIYSILSRDKMETRLKNPRKDIMELIYFISRHKQNVEGDRDVVLSCHYIQLDDVDLDLSASLRNYARTKKRDNSLPAKFHQEIKDIMFRYRGKSKRNGVNSWKPFRCAPHRDAMNKGMNKIIGLPGYEGGELIVDGEYIDIRNKLTTFDPKKEHSVNYFEGDRYTITFFTAHASPYV